MRPIYPAPLHAGSRIFVTAPSSGVAPPHHARLDHVLDTLCARGWVVEEGRCLRAEHRSATHWQRQWLDFVTHPLAGFQLTEPTAWRGLNRREDEAVQISGRLIGGCLDTLMHLVGTPFAPMAEWRGACGDEGVLLYLENCELAPPALVRALSQLRLAGWFDGLAGLLLGRSSGPDGQGPEALRYEDALRTALADLPCPVLFDLDIGHRPPQLTLINGARAELRWGAGERGSVVQWLD